MKNTKEFKLTFEEYRSAQLLILQQFADFCDRHNLKYFLVCGTLLGAIRHKGFIPWDDDIDIAMPFDDFNKLNHLLNEYLDISLNSSLNNDNRWSINDISIDLINSYSNSGHKIGIGVTGFDRIPSNNLLATFYFAFSKLLILLSWAKTDYVSQGTIKSSLKRIIKLLPFINHKNLYRCLFKFKNLFNTHLDSTNSRVGNISRKNEIHMLNQNYPLSKAKFEGMFFSCLKEYDIMLKDNYGDYMSLPPLEQRIRPHDEIDFFVTDKNLYNKIVTINNRRFRDV